MKTDRTITQRRFQLDLSEEALIDQDVEDALRATPQERMAAATVLLDTVYQLWSSQGFADGQGLCRVPGRIQQERRVLPSNRDRVRITAEQDLDLKKGSLFGVDGNSQEPEQLGHGWYISES